MCFCKGFIFLFKLYTPVIILDYVLNIYEDDIANTDCQNEQKSIKLSYASDFIFHFWGRFREFFECGGGADP